MLPQRKWWRTRYGGRCEGSLRDLQARCRGVLRSRGFALEQIPCPVEALAAEPGRGKASAATRVQHLGDGGLIGLGGRGGEGERDLGQSELEQAIAAA